MLKSGLAVWCYTAPGQQYYPAARVDYSRYVESLRFTTLQPGGFGQLTCTIRVPNARLPRYELALFSRIVVMAPATSINSPAHALFIGEMSQPELVNDEQGEYFNIQALGIGNCLRDDPRNVSYNGATPKSIITSEMTGDNRATWMPISTDQSQIFPDNPSSTFAPAYMGYAMEDIINDVCLLAGDYAWGVWAHPTQQDSFNFPLGQLCIHLRAPNTVGYQAFMATSDFVSWRITPAADRAYNAMTIAYTDPGGPNNYGTTSTIDSRLGASYQQQAAPFRFRRYFQDFSGTSTVGASQASSIESTQLGIMKNPTNKIQMVLRQIRNSGGQPVPLWSVQADQTIQAPELVQRGLQLGLIPAAGVNLFYILSTEYAEDSSGGQQLTLQCDNWYDYGQTRLARLELKAYRQAMNGTTTATVLASGSPDYGDIGIKGYNATASEGWGVMQSFNAILVNTPTSVTINAVASSNASSVATTRIDTHGFGITWTAGAVAVTEWFGNYTTVGNCILAVDLENGTFDHHCEQCGLVRNGLSLLEDIRVETPHEDLRIRDKPGFYALMIDCPQCGAMEGLNTNLQLEDEVETHVNPKARAHMAGLIRQICAHGPIQDAVKARAAAPGKGAGMTR